MNTESIERANQASAATNEGRQIKAISFDGDMTLWDFEKVMPECFMRPTRRLAVLPAS